MAHLDYNKAHEDFKTRVLEGIKSHFPMEGKLQKVELEDLAVQEVERHADDIQGQHAAKVEGKTWSMPVVGTLALKDASGKVLQRKTMRLADLPVLTRRHSYIMDGQEWQMDNQWQLMPGVYTKRKSNGVLESRFNVPNIKEFNLTFDPESKEFMMSRGKSKKIPAYPLMKALGVDDDTLERTWGREILDANKSARGVGTALEKFYRSDKKTPPPSQKEAAEYFRQKMQESKLVPEVTEHTLGKAFHNVEGETLARATKRMLEVQSGSPEDDRDSLEFKSLRTAGDFVFDRLASPKVKSSIRNKAVRKVNFAKDIREVVKSDMFNAPIRQSFSDNSAARIADQINPVEMLASSMQTTIMGPGGVQNQQAIDKMIGAKLINPSHFGFLDPVKTPESEKTGISLRMPMGVTKVGNEPRVRLYNLKTKKTELVNPRQFAKSTVALPDQVKWEGDTPKFIGSSVKASVVGNDFEEVKPKDVDYVMRHPSQMFNVTTNLIPFLNSNSGNRATYAGQHIEQAISLKEREAPLVRVGTGQTRPDVASWEDVIGKHTSHIAPIAGKVVSVSQDGITLQDRSGKPHKVSLYNNFPLNDRKSMLHSEPVVKVGDTVKKGQHVADTNFTKGGSLALGTNLNVAYIPYKGYNFEDGVVISRSAAKKLSSEHLHKPEAVLSEDTIADVKKFQVQHPEAFTRKQYDLLDEKGIVRVGQKVRPGDPLAISMRPYQLKDRKGMDPLRKVLAGVHTDTSLRWESDYPGEVVGVHRRKDKRGNVELAVHVRTEEPMQVGDKIAGRYGNKGIVTLVVDDDKMPRTTDGKHIEVALNPSGVPGRMNTGQVLETAASKIAEKTGKPYIVNNFDRASALDTVKNDLKKHGLSDQEELHDPVTGMSLGKALVGKQHMLKLTHQIDKKVAVRSGMTLPGGTDQAEGYDMNLIPSGGSKTGGQSIGHLGLYSLLAHGARANIREMQTWKSEGPDPQPNEAKKWPSQHNDVWRAIQEGTPMPPPKSTFAFKKFTDMLKGAGINVEKKGHQIQLTPLTDTQILKMSNGEVKKPHLTFSKVDPKTGDLKPRPGGFFDEKITGGIGGTKWSHIKLPEPVPNPVFEGPIQKLTGLKTKDYSALVTGEKALNASGKIVPLGTQGATTGGVAIKQLLDKIDVDKDLRRAESQLSELTVPTSASGKATPKVDALVKKVKYLRALQSADMKPSEAYVLNHVPVMPPALRTPSLLNGNSVHWSDVNSLYKSLGEKAGQFSAVANEFDDELKKPLRASLYDGVSALMGLGAVKKDQKDRGILEQIAGTSPKKGFFQKQLLNRKQDLTMRSTIVPEPALGLDEVGLPKDRALKLYLPFVVRKMQDMGVAKHSLEAQKMIKNKDPMVSTALEAVVSERPVLLKRDPALHKHSVQAFQPKLVRGKAIQIHPLVTSGFNADFDGDTMSAYVPISDEAVSEARKMFPSNNLYNEATGKVMYTPTLESALGLYKLSRVGEDTKKKFKNPGEAVQAVQQGKLGINDLATVGGIKTTPGRLLLASALPENMRSEVLTKHDKLIDKNGLGSMFTTLSKDYRGDFGTYANRLKDLGNGAASGAIPVIDGKTGPAAIAAAEKPKERRQYVPIPVHTLGLHDFEPDESTRRKYLVKAQAEVRAIEKTSLPKGEKERRSISAWEKASNAMTQEHMQKMQKNPTNLAIMAMAGVKPSVDQYKQMVLAPMIMGDASGAAIKTPVKKSYSEGLDVAGYWTQMHGARGGTVKKVQEVREPGYFSKQLMQTAMSTVVADEDCGTQRGVAMPVGSKDLADRVLAVDFKARGVTVPKGTVVTPTILDKMRAADKGGSIVVRSALKCEHGKGVCQKCAGVGPDGRFYDKGTNIGVLAAQSLGERSVQITMKAFHTGGVRSTGGTQMLNSFNRIEQLTKLPERIPDSTVLAQKSGTVEKVEKDPTGVKVWISGKLHHIGKDIRGWALHENLPHATKSEDYKPWKPPKPGLRVEAGQPLSDPNRTFINPHDLYRATGNMERVQNFLTDELYNIYRKEGVRRPHVETVVRAMGQMTKVQDPGDSSMLKGDFQNASKIRALNKALVKAGRKPIMHSPVLKGINVLPLQVQEDWMAKMQHEKLERSLLDAAATGAVSDIHGLHPVPGMVVGSEFGLTRKHSLRPGMQHLKDVPEHYY